MPSWSEIRFPFSFRGSTPEKSLLILLAMSQSFLLPLSEFGLIILAVKLKMINQDHMIFGDFFVNS